MVWLNNLRLKSKSPEARRKVLEALEGAADPRTRELLGASLADEDPQVRCAAVKAIERANFEQTVPSLISALQDPTSAVRAAAASGLGRLGDSRASAPLAKALKDPNDQVRACAGGALRTLAWKPGTAEEQALFEVALGNPRAAPARARRRWRAGRRSKRWRSNCATTRASTAEQPRRRCRTSAIRKLCNLS